MRTSPTDLEYPSVLISAPRRVGPHDALTSTQNDEDFAAGGTRLATTR